MDVLNINLKNSMFRYINFFELKVFLKDAEYKYFLEALEHSINEIRVFTILPPFVKNNKKYNERVEKNLNNIIKENFFKLKETFKKIEYILIRLELDFKTIYTYPLQCPLIIMDEILLNFIDKILNDSLKSDYNFFKGLINIRKLGISLKHCFDLGKIDFKN